MAGFQSMSYSKSRDAPMRFKPTPPAFELSKNTSKTRKCYSMVHVQLKEIKLLFLKITTIHLLNGTCIKLKEIKILFLKVLINVNVITFQTMLAVKLCDNFLTNICGSLSI